jgi:hypothetical protein
LWSQKRFYICREISKIDLLLPNQHDHGVHCHRPLLEPKDLQANAFVNDSCLGKNYSGNGVGNRSGGAAAMKTEVVENSGDGNRGSGGGNIEAVEPVAEK